MSDTDILAHKTWVLKFFTALDSAAPSELPSLVKTYFHRDAVYHAVHPINDVIGAENIAQTVYGSVKFAFPDFERRLYALMAGRFNDADWVCALGVFDATMSKPWLKIPANEALVQLRFGEFYRIEDNKIVEVFAIHDAIDLMRQVGIQPLPDSPAGIASIFPAPATGDGVRLNQSTPDETKASLDLVESMIFGLMKYDKSDLKSMGMDQFWSPKMLWYGPGGIGANRAVAGFQKFHQKPFLIAFPDRVGGNHKARFADGAYVASTGWPSINATHVGPWLGVPGTGNRITMRVMDWWRCEGGLLKENWVFIDVAHVLLQSGYDVFGRLE